jgi:hypothetical protein
MPSLDTNCILRWLLGDIPEQTSEVLARKTGNTPLYTFDHKLANQLSGTQLLTSLSQFATE